ncbi:MAG: FecR domain-containing protein, partial [Verrucomicrobiota bacterium]
MSEPSNEIRWKWVGEYLRGEASAETTAELERQLRADEEFRAQFIEHANVDLGLALLAETSSHEEKVTQFPGPIRRRKWAYTISVAAACLLAGMWVSLTVKEQPFADVVNQIGDVEADQITSSLRGEEVHLKSGLLELETSLGARLVIEAPAAFQFESAQLLRLHHGRIAATVPPSATGFSVQTPSGKAIDIGTEFGVDVPVEGEPEIHVFDGEVIAQSEDGTRKSLFGGEAFSLASGVGLARDLRSAAFVHAEELALFDGDDLQKRQMRSEQVWETLAADPALIAALNFEDQELPPGSYRMAQGRFPGSKAPEFVHEGEHMKLDVGGSQKWPE